MFVLDYLADQGMLNDQKSLTPRYRRLISQSVLFDIRGWWSSYIEPIFHGARCPDLGGPSVHVPFPACWFEVGTRRCANGIRETMAMATKDLGKKAEVLIFISRGGPVAHVCTTYLIQDVETPSRLVFDFKPGPFVKEHPQFAGLPAYGLLMLLNLLRFLECKHQVALRDKSAPRPRTLRRLALSKDVRFKVLTIRLRRGDSPIELCDDSEGAGGRPLPLFLMRGHFQTYTAAAPLFGNLVGRWWWAPQVRGDARNGIIDKSYFVPGPSPAVLVSGK